MTYHARVTAEGVVEFPEELVRELELTPGGSLVIKREDGKLILTTFDEVVRDTQRRAREIFGADYTLDQFITERRADGGED